MYVNSNGWTQREFIRHLAINCDSREGEICKKTKFPCKDYLCPIVKSAKDIAEVRSNFARQAKQKTVKA